MTHEEMVAQMGKGVSPLRLSIKKWEDIAANKGTNEGLENCALCARFLTSRPNSECSGCPIYKCTDRRTCHGTPYTQFLYHVRNCDDCEKHAADPKYCNEAIEIAKEELEFLNSLEEEATSAES